MAFIGFGLAMCVVGCVEAPSTPSSRGSTSPGVVGRLPPSPLSPRAVDDVLVRPDHTFIDLKYHVEGSLPETWSLRPIRHRGEGEETMLVLRDPEYSEANAFIYYRFFDPPMTLTEPKEIDDWLRHTADQKNAARSRDGFTNYENKDVVSRIIAGRPAVTWTAKYVEDGEEWGEYLTRVYSPKGTLLFSLRAPMKDFPEMIRRLEVVIQSTTFP